MKRERLPNWILKYKRKAKSLRVCGVLCLIFSFDCFVFGPFQRILGDLTDFENFIANCLFFAFFVLFGIGLGLIIAPRVRHKKIDDYYICHYVGWKNRLIIDGEEEDSSVMGKCYGTLPDGREIESGGAFSITFKVTDPQTGRTRRL